MNPFFLIRYACIEPSAQRSPDGCDCGLREMRPEILCAVMAKDRHDAAKQLGGQCGGLTMRMDPDHERSGNMSDCTLYSFIPGKSTHVDVLSSLGRSRERYSDAMQAALSPDARMKRGGEVYLVTSHVVVGAESQYVIRE